MGYIIYFVLGIVFILLMLILFLKGLKAVNIYINNQYIQVRNCAYKFIHQYRSLVIIFIFIIVFVVLTLSILYDRKNHTDLGDWFSGLVALLIALGTSWNIPPFLKIMKSFGSANSSCSIQIINLTRASDYVELKHIYLTNHFVSKNNYPYDQQILIPRYMAKYTVYNYVGSHGSLFIPIFFPTKSKCKLNKEKKFIEGFLHSKYRYIKFDFDDTYKIDIPPVYFSKEEIKYRNKNIKKL